eukprot:gene16576-biopygen10607
MPPRVFLNPRPLRAVWGLPATVRRARSPFALRRFRASASAGRGCGAGGCAPPAAVRGSSSRSRKSRGAGGCAGEGVRPPGPPAPPLHRATESQHDGSTAGGRPCAPSPLCSGGGDAGQGCALGGENSMRTAMLPNPDTARNRYQYRYRCHSIWMPMLHPLRQGDPEDVKSEVNDGGLNVEVGAEQRNCRKWGGESASPIWKMKTLCYVAKTMNAHDEVVTAKFEIERHHCRNDPGKGNAARIPACAWRDPGRLFQLLRDQEGSGFAVHSCRENPPRAAPRCAQRGPPFFARRAAPIVWRRGSRGRRRRCRGTKALEKWRLRPSRLPVSCDAMPDCSRSLNGAWCGWFMMRMVNGDGDAAPDCAERHCGSALRPGSDHTVSHSHSVRRHSRQCSNAARSNASPSTHEHTSLLAPGNTCVSYSSHARDLARHDGRRAATAGLLARTALRGGGIDAAAHVYSVRTTSDHLEPR